MTSPRLPEAFRPVGDVKINVHQERVRAFFDKYPEFRAKQHAVATQQRELAARIQFRAAAAVPDMIATTEQKRTLFVMAFDSTAEAERATAASEPGAKAPVIFTPVALPCDAPGFEKSVRALAATPEKAERLIEATKCYDPTCSIVLFIRLLEPRALGADFDRAKYGLQASDEVSTFSRVVIMHRAVAETVPVPKRPRVSVASIADAIERGESQGDAKAADAAGLFPCGLSSCGKRETKAARHQRCNGCHKTLYCSRECQRADWKRHRPACLLLRV